MSSEKRIYVMQGVKMPMDTYSKVSEEWKPLYDKAKELGTMFEVFEEFEYCSIYKENYTIELIVDSTDGDYFAVGRLVKRINEDDDYIDICLKNLSEQSIQEIIEGIKELIGVEVKPENISTIIFTHWV